MEAKLIAPSVDGVFSPSSVSHIKPLMRKIIPSLLGEEESLETFLHDRHVICDPIQNIIITP